MYKNYYNKLQETGKYRSLPKILDNNISYLDFSTNDYLGLSKNYELLGAATLAAMEYGVGATGSRLLSGNSQIVEDLESSIARDKNTEAALVFNSGFQANLSVLSALLDKSVLETQPLVFFDKLNHASLYQAVFLSGAELIRYYHNNMDQLGELLDKYKNDSRPKFIVAETIFGMDGDLLPLDKIISLAQEFEAFLYLDEAHATGLIGKNGYGLSTDYDLSIIPHVIMGSFSKALGCCGAYIACSYKIKNYLINKCAGFIYSTALSPMIVGAAAKAWKLVAKLNKERSELMKKADYLRMELKKLGFNTGNSGAHIIPIIIGDETKTMAIKGELLKKSIIVSAIRPPTVPPLTSRLRIALNLSHSWKDLDFLMDNLHL